MTTETEVKPKPIPVDEFVTADKVREDLAFNQADLNDAFIRQPGHIAYYTSITARAERQHSELKLRLEAMEAKAATNIRDKALEDKEKLTADMVKERVRLHPQVVRVEQALIRAKEVESTLKGVVAAFKDRRESLTMLGLMDRDERKARIDVMDGMGSAGRSPREVWKERLASNA